MFLSLKNGIYLFGLAVGREANNKKKKKLAIPLTKPVFDLCSNTCSQQVSRSTHKHIKELYKFTTVHYCLCKCSPWSTQCDISEFTTGHTHTDTLREACNLQVLCLYLSTAVYGSDKRTVVVCVCV